MNHPSPLRNSVMRRALASIAILATCTSTPIALAGEADGTYRISKISSTLNVPKKVLAQAVSSNNRITVRNHQITIRRENWLGVLETYNFLFFGGTAKYSGPKSLTLEPGGGSFTGKTTRPVKISLAGSFLDLPVQMNLRTSCRAKITGNQMVLTFPVHIVSDGEQTASGTVRVVAKR